MFSKDRLLMISITLLLLVIVLVALPAATYKVKAADLAFDTISKQTAYVGNEDASARIQVITSPSSSPSNLDLLPSDQSLIQSVDYSQYFVLAVFYGYGSSEQNDIIKIAQFKDIVWVESGFPTPPSEANKVSPYQIVEIKTGQMSQFGELTFRLVNDVFVDKAKASQTFTPGSS
jgi:hypothetical protein